MDKCEKRILRMVRGNTFKLRIKVVPLTVDGTVIEDFDLTDSNPTLRVGHNGTWSVQEFTIVSDDEILVGFAGNKPLGVYGLEMSGQIEGTSIAWRWCDSRVFQIVETNASAWIPENSIVEDGTYLVQAGVSITGGDGATFYPSVSEEGVISWTNNAGLPNPQPVNIKGPKGDTGATGPQGPQGPEGPQGPAGSDAGVTEIQGIMPIVFGTYNESTGAYDNTYLKEDSSSGASWLYDIAPHIHQEMWSGSSEETTFRIHIGIIQGTTDVYGSVLAYITPTGSYTLKVSFSFEGVDYTVLFDVSVCHATTTAYKLSHLVANEENKFYDTGLYLEELVPTISASTYEKLSALRMTNAYDKMLLVRGFRSGQGAGTYAVATVKFWGSTFEFYVDDNGTTVHVQGDSQNNWTITRTTPYTKPSGGIPSSDLSSAVQTSLGKADTALQEESVFVATYGTTTAAEIVTAYEADKVVVIMYNGFEYILSRITTDNIYFSCLYSNSNRYIRIARSGNTYADSAINLEDSGNKVTSLSSSSTDSQYPSAKCVYDLIGDVESLLAAI